MPSLKSKERIDWTAFLRPFRVVPWLLVVSSIFISSIVSGIIWYIRDDLTIFKSITVFLTNIQALFNEASALDTPFINLWNSHRLAAFVSLLWAWFIWTSYNAGLASEFTVPVVKLPFNDMDSLSKTEYRYNKGVTFT